MWTLTTHGKYSVSGDEPHYLIVSQSLWADGDIDTRNNFRAGESRFFGVDALEPGLHFQDTPDGKLFPVHDIGLSVALLPIYTAAVGTSRLMSESGLRRFRMSPGLFAYSLISLVLIGVSCLAATLTQTALASSRMSEAAAGMTVLALWLSAPVLSNSFLIFPEIFALLLTAWAIQLAGSAAPASDRTLFVFAAALGTLPWFHRKFAVYAAALLVAFAWQQRRRLVSWNPNLRIVALLCFVVPQLLLAVWTWCHWGNLGGPLTVGGFPLSWNTLRVGVLGQLVDRENGLLIWAPVYAVLPVAVALAPRRDLVWLGPAIVLFLLSAAHDQWWGGFSPAGRFLLPVIPLLALIASEALRNRAFRRACIVLLIPQMMLSAYCWQHPRALWQQGHGENQAVASVLQWTGVTPNIFPSFRSSSPHPSDAIPAFAVLVLANLGLWLLCKRSHIRRASLAGITVARND